MREKWARDLHRQMAAAEASGEDTRRRLEQFVSEQE
jgi:hypothetical protein